MSYEHDDSTAGGSLTPGPESSPAGEDAGASPRNGLAWERRFEIGLAAGVLGTIREVVFSPTAAFRAMRQEGGWAEPLAFAVLVGSVAVWVAQGWDVVTSTLLAGMTGAQAQDIVAANIATIWLALFAPLLVCASTFFGAAIVHGLLLLFGGAPKPYETTFRVVSYSWAVGVFNLVPICGVFLGSVWRIVVQIIGVREAQEVPPGRAAAAVLVPLLLLCFCLAMLVVATVGLAGLVQLGMQ